MGAHRWIASEDWGRYMEKEELEEGPPLPPNERQVIASPLDFSVESLVGAATARPARLYLDTFQRAYVWNIRKASRLIESLVLNIPIPVCYFAEEKDGKLSIIDGNQRITTLIRFLGNEFALRGLEAVPDLNGHRFHQLSEAVRNHIKTRAIRCLVIDKRSSPQAKFEVFSRLNTAATPLNNQELRNCLQRGPFNNLLHELSKDEEWLELVGRPKPDKRMRDAELILRFFALTDALDDYERPLRKFLTDWMEERRFESGKVLDSRREKFKRAVDFWLARLGPGRAFRRIEQDGTAERRFIAAIFDAQMVGFGRAGKSSRTAKTVERFTIEATQDGSKFMDSVLRGSSHADAMKWRIDHYTKFLAGR